MMMGGKEGRQAFEDLLTILRRNLASNDACSLQKTPRFALGYARMTLNTEKS